jgi:hypothetical protein
VYGSLANPRRKAQGSKEFLITAVVKPHPALGGRRTLVLPDPVPVEDPNNPPRLLVFCDVAQGIDPYEGLPAQPAVVGYLKGLLALRADDGTGRLHYCFNFLDHADPALAADALREFGKAPDAEVCKAARQLPAGKLRRWLKDPKTPADRLRLYGFLLGHCGAAADAALLRGLAARQVKEASTAELDRLLTGYTLLEPKAGWAYTRALTANASNDFVVRYAGLRSARFFYDTRPDVVGRKAVLDALTGYLSQGDLADLVIEDLRRWRCWGPTARVLALYRQPSHQAPIVRRAVVRYALQCPRPEAAAFLVNLRKAEAAFVGEGEEALKLEAAGR